jgi:E3 ubiquitin-protein ligase TRIP12
LPEAKLIIRSRLHWFNTLGIFIGRALLDSRIIDLNLNKVLLQLILGVPIKKNIATLRLIDEQLARSLERLQSYLNARKEIEALPLGPEARNNKLGSLTVGGAQLGDLSLDFTVPGHGIELKVRHNQLGRWLIDRLAERRLMLMIPIWKST